MYILRATPPAAGPPRAVVTDLGGPRDGFELFWGWFWSGLEIVSDGLGMFFCAYPATVPTTQYPFCSLSPDVFSSDLFAACLQNLKCLCTILYCNVSPGVFNESVYAL